GHRGTAAPCGWAGSGACPGASGAAPQRHSSAGACASAPRGSPPRRATPRRGEATPRGPQRGTAASTRSGRTNPSPGTTPGTPWGGDTSGGDTSGGDTSRGDTSGGDTRKAALRRLRSRGSHREDARGGGGGADPGGPRGPRGPRRGVRGGAAGAVAEPPGARGPPGAGGGGRWRRCRRWARSAAWPPTTRCCGCCPRGAWVPRGAVQRLLFPFPRQQECGLSLLEHMERYGVMPDAKTQFLLLLPQCSCCPQCVPAVTPMSPVCPCCPHHVPMSAGVMPDAKTQFLLLSPQCPCCHPGVMPDAETQFLLLGVFGPRSRPMRKLQRMLFWLPRLRLLGPPPAAPPAAPRAGGPRAWGCSASPPSPGPPSPSSSGRCGTRGTTKALSNPTSSARRAPSSGSCWPSTAPPARCSWRGRSRSGSAGPSSNTSCCGETPCPRTWATPPHPPHHRHTPTTPPHPPRTPPADPERSFYFPLRLELELERGPWDDDAFHVDEVEEGPVLALCVAGAGDRRTLGRWLAALQELNPALARTPVVFRLAPGGDPAADPPRGHPAPPAGRRDPRPGRGVGAGRGRRPEKQRE
ncbi:LOW QUALITY PROTEIN: evolutionarily conserved signaling intermediate in Toll pathway, mitochondrial, partial [Vidua macroura]|uniref:LOW QUALITY PROTEIN: evolutionarily conserved signaling intermediate in Toll pathway, mitochondrial n=1 Tax=Vidua macroura TaxID=187451 RepID=UPI0023A8EB2C